jgi:hypothetical protein
MLMKSLAVLLPDELSNHVDMKPFSALMATLVTSLMILQVALVCMV